MNKGKIALTVPPLRVHHEEIVKALFLTANYKSKIFNVHFGAHSEKDDNIDNVSLTVRISDSNDNEYFVLCSFRMYLQCSKLLKLEKRSAGERILDFLNKLIV